jgi:peroxiredoxin
VAATSTMMPLGTPAPPFALADPDGRVTSSEALADAPALLVMFLCNHCPYVRHVREGLAALTAEYIDKGVAVVGINPNDYEAFPDDAPERMAEEAREVGYRFPYLIDEDQEVAKAYGAACTPDFFLFDANRRLVYRGQMDDSRPNNGVPVTGESLRAALDAVLSGDPPLTEQHPSMGCSVKWRPGNEPG